MSSSTSPRTCTKCGHYDETDPRGRCISTYYDAGGSLVYCGCQCEFSPASAAPVVDEPHKRRKWVYSEDVMEALANAFDSMKGQTQPVSEVGYAVYKALLAVPEFTAAATAAPVDHAAIPLLGYERVITIEWNKHNARRHELIEAGRTRLLSENEMVELHELQWLAGIKRELGCGPLPAAAEQSGIALKQLEPYDMTDEELRAEIHLIESTAGRRLAALKSESAKIWRLRLRVDGGTDEDKARLWELNKRRELQT